MWKRDWLAKFRKGVKNPRKAFRFIAKTGRIYTVHKPARRYLFSQHRPTNALEEDFDNLIILDACRHDVFEDLNTLPGDLDYRFSPASATMEWIKKVVDGKKFHDTVYVTANPRINRYEDKFHKVIPAWRTNFDEKLKVTPPSSLADLTIEAYNEFPNKRIVAHFMQPHIPFIGDFGRSEIGIYDGTTGGRNRALGNEWSLNTEPYVLLEQGKLDRESIKKAYRENVEVTLPEVDRLLESMRGKSIVTADHGEMFGEVGWPTPFRAYGHPLRHGAKSLLKVPWLEYTNDERRRTKSQSSDASGERIDDEEIKDRLKQLGYK